MRRIYEVEVTFSNGKIIKEEVTAPTREEAVIKLGMKHNLSSDFTENCRVTSQYKGTLGAPEEPVGEK